MPKLSTAFAASALLIALSAPSFAADLDGSVSPHSSGAAVQNRDDLNAGTSTSSGMNPRLNNESDLSGSTSLNHSSGIDRDRELDRDQSAQLPNADRDSEGRGRSSTSPGHEMQENGYMRGSPGASGYVPGQAGR